MDVNINKPLVSAVMTVYNAEAYIAEAIDSILSQTYSHFELLILNDASTDGSEKIILEKQSKDARINYFVNEKNMGLAEVRNKIVNLTQGELIAITDADDVYAPHRFEEQVKFLTKHPDVAIVGSSANLINHQGKVCDAWYYPLEDAEIKAGLNNSLTLANPTTMFRRQVFFKIGGYDKRLAICEDWNFFHRAAAYFKFANISEPLVYYRFHQSNSSFVKLENTILYTVCYKFGLSEECYKSTVLELIKQYPQYTSEVTFSINRFYTFMMHTFLRLNYRDMSNALYEQVTRQFFPFFDRHSKKIFIKSALVLHLKDGYYQRIPALLTDYIFAK